MTKFGHSSPKIRTCPGGIAFATRVGKPLAGFKFKAHAAIGASVGFWSALFLYASPVTFVGSRNSSLRRILQSSSAASINFGSGPRRSNVSLFSPWSLARNAKLSDSYSCVRNALGLADTERRRAYTRRRLDKVGREDSGIFFARLESARSRPTAAEDYEPRRKSIIFHKT